MPIDPGIIAGVALPAPQPQQNALTTLTQIESVKALKDQREALASERMQQAQALVQKAKDTAATNAALQQAQGDYGLAGDILTKGGNGTLAGPLYDAATARSQKMAAALEAHNKASKASLDTAAQIMSTMGDSPEHYQSGLTAVKSIMTDPDDLKAFAAIAPDNPNPADIPGIVDRLTKFQVGAQALFTQHTKNVDEYLNGNKTRALASQMAITPPAERADMLKTMLAMEPDYRTRQALQDQFVPLLTATPDALHQMSLTSEQQVNAADKAADNARQEAQATETARHNRAMEARPVAGAGLTGAQTSDVTETVKGMNEGTIPPILPSRASKEYLALTAEAHRQGVDLSKLNEDWNATQKYLGTLNGAQQTRLRQAIQFTSESLPNIRNLINEWDSKGLPVLSKANLDSAAAGAQGQAAQSLAVRLKGQVADLTSELGTVYKGGNSSTDESLKLAAQNLSADWSKKAALDALTQIEQNIHVRQNSMRNLAPVTNQGSLYVPTTGDTAPAPSARGGGAGAPAMKAPATGPLPPKGAAVGDTWMSPTGLRVWNGQKWTVGG